MAKQRRVFEGVGGNITTCPHMKGFYRHSKFHFRAECDLAKKGQTCIEDKVCTQWVKEK